MESAQIVVRSDNNPAFNAIRQYLLRSHVDFEIMHFDEGGLFQTEHYERKQDAKGEFYMARIHPDGSESIAHR